MTRITEADRKLMAPAGIDLGGKCDWCSINDVRESDLRNEVAAWNEVASGLRWDLETQVRTVRDQRETIDRMGLELYREKTHFWMLAIVPVFMLAYGLYKVRP